MALIRLNKHVSKFQQLGKFIKILVLVSRIPALGALSVGREGLISINERYVPHKGIKKGHDMRERAVWDIHHVHHTNKTKGCI